MQHVATWREGDEKWAYHEDAFKNMATHKVSLDPYRLECRKILALIKDTLPPSPISKVEKASIDEVFLDLSTQVHQMLLDRYPMLKGPAPYDDPTEQLPRPPTSALEWKTDALVDLDPQETEDDDPDWDDIVMLIASEIVRGVRETIYTRLSYTCSAGIARNKMLAKLGSAYKKPNQQTIVRNRAIQKFLGDFKFTKIRNLGGKLGDEVVAAFDTDSVSDLLQIPIEQLKKQLSDDTATWLYRIIRGEDYSEVNPRTQIKSMLSAKSFRPSINTLDSAVRWLRIFIADIFSRLVEEGVLENKRRPKSMNLIQKQGETTRRKSAPIPMGRAIDETILFDIAKNLLAQSVAQGRAWPCSNLSLSVSGFEEGITGNMGISSFLVRGPAVGSTATTTTEIPYPPAKRRKVDDRDIQGFFDRSTAKDEDPDIAVKEVSDDLLSEIAEQKDEDTCIPPRSAQIPAGRNVSQDAVNTVSSLIDDNEDFAAHVPSEKYNCARCNRSIPIAEQGEHEDWHFANDLQKEERTSMASNVPPRAKSVTSQKRQRGRGKPSGGSNVPEKGQSRLTFG